MRFIKNICKVYRLQDESVPIRRFDLDWLRVLAFGLLIFYHIGMLYVENWGFHIKSQYLSSQLESAMLLVNPWRMPILWMISGIAIRFIVARVSVFHFIKWRSYRLLLPLLFGILVVVPPQLYYEMGFKDGLEISYLEFYAAFWQLENPLFDSYQPGIWPHIDVNHLWYLRELWTFSIYLLVLLPIFNSRPVELLINGLAQASGWLLTPLLAAPIIILQFSIEEPREALGFLFLCYGYLLGWHAVLWEKLKNNSLRLLCVGLLCYLALVYFYNTYWMTQSDDTPIIILIAGRVIHSVDQLIWVLAMLGVGFRYLNHPSSLLTQLNEAVYPFYILHQTVIIVIAAELSGFNLGGPLEGLTVIILTTITCSSLYLVIKKFNLLRALFGLKLKAGNSLFKHSVSIALVSLIVILFGLEILI